MVFCSVWRSACVVKFTVFSYILYSLVFCAMYCIKRGLHLVQCNVVHCIALSGLHSALLQYMQSAALHLRHRCGRKPPKPKLLSQLQQSADSVGRVLNIIPSKILGVTRYRAADILQVNLSPVRSSNMRGDRSWELEFDRRRIELKLVWQPSVILPCHLLPEKTAIIVTIICRN